MPKLTFSELVGVFNTLSDEGAIVRTTKNAALFDRLKENGQIQPIAERYDPDIPVPEHMLSMDGLQDAIEALVRENLAFQRRGAELISLWEERINNRMDNRIAAHNERLKAIEALIIP